MEGIRAFKSDGGPVEGDRLESRTHLAVGNRPLEAKTAKNTGKRQKKDKADAATNET